MLFLFCKTITLLYQVLEKIDAVEEKQCRGVDVSRIALSVKVQLKMLVQHNCSSSSNKTLQEILFLSLYLSLMQST